MNFQAPHLMSASCDGSNLNMHALSTVHKTKTGFASNLPKYDQSEPVVGGLTAPTVRMINKPVVYEHDNSPSVPSWSLVSTIGPVGWPASVQFLRQEEREQTTAAQKKKKREKMAQKLQFTWCLAPHLLPHRRRATKLNLPAWCSHGRSI